MSDVITVPSHTKKDNPKAALKPRPHRQRRNQVPTSSFQMTGDTWPETAGPQITALARHDPDTGTVTLVLDSATADIAMFALAAHAGEREAHAREVERSGADWPDGSYGRRNRQAIAARETRVATRLRAIQHAYQAVAGHGTALTPTEPTRTLHPPGHTSDREIELE